MQPVIVKADSRTINYIALGVLLLFILSHYFFRIKYKGENSDHHKSDLKL